MSGRLDPRAIGFTCDERGVVILPTIAELRALHGIERGRAVDLLAFAASVVHDTYGFAVETELSRRRENAVVYFAEAKAVGLIKIGYSTDVAHRIRHLRAETGHDLVLLATFRGDVGDERRIHNRFADSRSHGEWFRSTPALLAYIDELARPA